MSAFAEIYERVERVISQALNVDEERITPNAALQRDLGAESIDLLDIVFRLERTFAIRIPREELFPESIFQGDEAFVSDGIVTDAGMAELRLKMPYANVDDLDRRLAAIPDMFTVDLVARYIAWKLSIPVVPVLREFETVSETSR